MRRVVWLILLGIVAAWSVPADALTIASITRLKGNRPNVIVGLGLVFGLNGSGDGGDFAPTIKPMAELLRQLNNSVTAQQLGNAQNVALVYVRATISSGGAHNGDRVDVYVSSVGAAKSLKGGRLFPTPLLAPVPGAQLPVMATAEGPISIEDPSTPLTGSIKGGAVMEEDWELSVIENGKLTLILDEPSADWTTASTIARIINDAEGNGQTIATARDRTQVEVVIPLNERERPDSFIARIQQLPVRVLPTEARVQINEREGSIIITGDVEISPTIISHKGLVISTITPAPVPTPRTPITTEKHTVVLDTTNQGGSKLKDLVDALDAIKVPAADRITIIKELHKSGKLHAKLVTE